MPQNSINAPLPLAVNKGGTGRSTPGLATFTFNYNVSGTVTMAPFNYYAVSQNGVTFRFPADAARGDMYMIQGWWLMVPTTGFSIAKQGSQTFQFSGSVGNILTTTNANGGIILTCVEGSAGIQTFGVLSTNNATFAFSA